MNFSHSKWTEVTSCTSLRIYWTKQLKVKNIMSALIWFVMLLMNVKWQNWISMFYSIYNIHTSLSSPLKKKKKNLATFQCTSTMGQCIGHICYNCDKHKHYSFKPFFFYFYICFLLYLLLCIKIHFLYVYNFELKCFNEMWMTLNGIIIILNEYI